MTHIDEHTLELYVLGAAEVASRKNEIESHLRECSGCKRTVERMTAFYAEAEKEFQARPQNGDATKKALVRARAQVEPFYETDSSAVPFRPVTTMQRFQYFVRRHPVMMGGGTFFLLASLALLFNFNTTLTKSDMNPNAIYYNDAEKKIEVLNKKNETIWSIRNPATEEIGSSAGRGIRHVIALFDLDNDGTKEIITTIGFPANAQQNPIRVLDGEGNKKNSLMLQREINYLNRVYASTWSAGWFAIDSSNAGDPSIFVNWGIGRSPNFFTRLNRKLEVVGEYWHFGGTMSMRVSDLDNDGKTELIITGQNEAQDTVDGEYPAFVILDPRKIVGVGKSVLSEGFKIPFSQAEMYYVRLPVSTIKKAMNVAEHEVVEGIGNISEKLFSCNVRGPEFKGFPILFEYMFTRKLEIVEVKSSNGADELYEVLVQQGKLAGRLNSEYLLNLKNDVRYWDGKEWRKEVVRIRHPQLTIEN